MAMGHVSGDTHCSDARSVAAPRPSIGSHDRRSCAFSVRSFSGETHGTDARNV